MLVKVNVVDLLIFSLLMESQIMLTVFAIFYATMLVNVERKSARRRRKYFCTAAVFGLLVAGAYFGIPLLHFLAPAHFGCGVDLKALHFVVYGISTTLVGALMAMSDAMMLNYMNLTKVRKTGFLSDRKRSVD